mmetsp:Transcript_52879/g.137784  ORF Transcript_52879/g.137784 Transcript_52879/m.137784 type:complete len:205 (+) Transcript_52879:386-1000(+)
MPRPGPGDRGSNEEQLSTVLRPSGELSSRRSAVLPPQARFSGHHAQNLIAVACAEDQRVWCSAPRSSRRSERAAQGRVSDWVTAPAPPLRLDELQEHQLSPCALGSAQAHGDGRCTVSGAPGQDAKAQSAWRLGPCDCSAEGRLILATCSVGLKTFTFAYPGALAGFLQPYSSTFRSSRTAHGGVSCTESQVQCCTSRPSCRSA